MFIKMSLTVFDLLERNTTVGWHAAALTTKQNKAKSVEQELLEDKTEQQFSFYIQAEVWK